MFKAITEAFELLSDPKRRRTDYSTTLTTRCRQRTTTRRRAATLQGVRPDLRAQLPLVELPNCPLLGGADDAFDGVASF